MAQRLIIKLGNVFISDAGHLNPTAVDKAPGAKGTMVLNGANSVSIIEATVKMLGEMKPVSMFTTNKEQKVYTVLVLAPELNPGQEPVSPGLVNQFLAHCSELSALAAYTHDDGTAVVMGHAPSTPSGSDAANTLIVETADGNWSITTDLSDARKAKNEARRLRNVERIRAKYGDQARIQEQDA